MRSYIGKRSLSQAMSPPTASSKRTVIIDIRAPTSTVIAATEHDVQLNGALHP